MEKFHRLYTLLKKLELFQKITFVENIIRIKFNNFQIYTFFGNKNLEIIFPIEKIFLESCRTFSDAIIKRILEHGKLFSSKWQDKCFNK